MVKEARKKTIFWSHSVTLTFGAICTLYMCFQVYGIYSKKLYTSDLLNKSASEQVALQDEYRKTRERVLLLDNPLGRDMFYREKRNYVEVGEEVYVIVRDPNLSQTPTTTRSWASMFYFWR